MTRSSDTVAGRIETAALTCILVLAVLGLALLPLTTSWYVRAMVRQVDSAELTGLSLEATVQTAEHVRRFVVSSSAPPLPAEVEGVSAYDEAAVDHLLDVRAVLVPARWLALALGGLWGLWASARLRTASARRRVRASLRLGGAVLVVAPALAMLAGLADFDALFARFHDLFFAPGTWMFPADALLIRVFPAAFWVASGAVWGLLVAVCGVVCVALARRMRFTAGNNGV
jgi:hypothetical protein